jgi:ABC-2 type transport system ATP-binding protein
VAPIIEVDKLTKMYGDLAAAKDVSFAINEGEIFSLLGPNGAGKTTTISMLSCLLKPTGGDATVCGHSIVREPMAVKEVIGVVPQEIALYDPLSARQNLMFWGRMYGMGGTALKARVDEVLEQIGLTDRANEAVKTYSGGMKRRLNIGVGLLHRPRVIFMDEPTVGIDPQSRRNILDAVKDLNRQGMTVLYTTHYMEEAQEISDRVGIIDHGRLIALGTQPELKQIVGQSETIWLNLDEGQDPEELTGIVDALGTVPGVTRSSLSDHRLAVTAAEADDVLVPLITRANDLGAKVRSVEIQEPNLEAVFLHLTGRALRD